MSDTTSEVLSFDPSALDSYLEAILPEVGAALRAGMRAAIIRGVTAHTATLLDRVENEVVGRDGRIIKAVSPEHARQIYIVNLLRYAKRTALANLRKEYGCE